MVEKCITLDESEDEPLYISWEDFKKDALAEEKKILKEEALKEGIIEGAKQKEIDIIKNMLKNKFSIDDIIKCTGLSKNKLDSIINN